MNAGDLATARDYLTLAVRHARRGRNDADAARRLAVRHHLLARTRRPDRPRHSRRGRRHQPRLGRPSQAVCAQLALSSLDPDPLATVKSLVKHENASGDGAGHNGTGNPATNR